MKIKLCGMRREEDIVFANRYRPDYIVSYSRKARGR